MVAPPVEPKPAEPTTPARVESPVGDSAKVEPVLGPAREYEVLTPIDYQVDGKETHLEIGARVSDLPVAVVGGLLMARAIKWPDEVMAAAIEDAATPRAELIEEARTESAPPTAPPAVS